MSPEEYKQILAKYLPGKAVEDIYSFFERYKVHFHITRQRYSKLGDYRWPQPKHHFHEISVNGNLNPYHFLLVTLHEMAHLNAYERYDDNVQPHGHEWQDEYRQLMLQYIGCFPPELAGLIRQYAKAVPLNRTAKSQLEIRLRMYDTGRTDTPSLSLNELKAGDRFRLATRPTECFQTIEKRRTRWLCVRLNDNQQCLVNGTAEVERIEDRACGERGK